MQVNGTNPIYNRNKKNQSFSGHTLAKDARGNTIYKFYLPNNPQNVQVETALLQKHADGNYTYIPGTSQKAPLENGIYVYKPRADYLTEDKTIGYRFLFDGKHPYFDYAKCINDKKARFLKRVEEEGLNEIVFKIFLNHYDEKQNDEISGRGSFRKAIHAISALNKYGFNPILVINTPQQHLAEFKAGFTELGKKFKFETDDINFSFLLYNQTPENENSLLPQEQWNFDCMNSRMLSKSGVYNCFSLLNDYRGRSGANLCDFSKKCYMETEKCRACKYFGQQMYANNWV